MDKEILEMLKNINETLKKVNGANCDYIKEKISEAFNEPAEVSIKKEADGKAITHVEGRALPILITLAGLEKAVVEKLDASTGVWELIKETVGTKEVE